MPAKVAPECRPITGTAVHGFVKMLVLYQFNRIVSIDVVERENESFGCRGVAARTWKYMKITTQRTFYIIFAIEKILKYAELIELKDI